MKSQAFIGHCREKKKKKAALTFESNFENVRAKKRKVLVRVFDFERDGKICEIGKFYVFGSDFNL